MAEGQGCGSSWQGKRDTAENQYRKKDIPESDTRGLFPSRLIKEVRVMVYCSTSSSFYRQALPWTGFCFSRNLPAIFLSIWFVFASIAGLLVIWYHMVVPFLPGENRKQTTAQYPTSTTNRTSCSGYYLTLDTLEGPGSRSTSCTTLWNKLYLCSSFLLEEEAVVVWTWHWHSRRKRV